MVKITRVTQTDKKKEIQCLKKSSGVQCAMIRESSTEINRFQAIFGVFKVGDIPIQLSCFKILEFSQIG